ncbi:hypothetical protein HII31_08031 [Pseudocercospora fuligena]|uniref:Uncharacterized protein n=1 Tax=Pseudocercospora fuligena TaxID=685502 RepID=A0A8H6VHN7_9PEZI|nr:hypothetical protein HII31_08031 [Pseudocercospora fuligena]
MGEQAPWRWEYKILGILAREGRRRSDPFHHLHSSSCSERFCLPPSQVLAYPRPRPSMSVLMPSHIALRTVNALRRGNWHKRPHIASLHCPSNSSSDEDPNGNKVRHNNEHNLVVYEDNFQPSEHSHLDSVQLCRSHKSAATETSTAASDCIETAMFFSIDESECNLICLQLSFYQKWRHYYNLHNYHNDKNSESHTEERLQTETTVNATPTTTYVFSAPSFTVANEVGNLWSYQGGCQKDQESGCGGIGFTSDSTWEPIAVALNSASQLQSGSGWVAEVAPGVQSLFAPYEVLSNTDTDGFLPLTCSVSQASDGTCPLTCQVRSGDVNQGPTDQTTPWYLGPPGAVSPNTYKTYAVTRGNACQRGGGRKFRGRI